MAVVGIGWWDTFDESKTKVIQMTTTGATRIETSGGIVHGVRIDGVRTWRGIPFGVAERWKAPHPVHWEGEWPADEYGNVAPQTAYNWKDEVIGDEDCLNLDIVRPDTEDKLPVVIFLHGGGFFAGASHTAVLRGHNFAKELDVVYVALNFRLGALGYVDLSSLEVPDAHDCEANPATRDQILALQWVQRNIESFGGDPNNVVLMGESAGGTSAAALMAMPAARGLFHRVILQSAPVMSVHTNAQSNLWARKLAQYSGLVPRTTSIAELRALPFADVVRAGQQMLWKGRGLRQLNAAFGIAIDGELLSQHPLDVFEQSLQQRIPLLIGTNNDELSAAQILFFSKSARLRTAREMLRAHDPALAEDIEAAYGDIGRRGVFAQMLTDAVFWAQSVRLAELHQAAGAPVWMYRFDYAPAMLRRLGVGAMHSMELSALFGDAKSSKASFVLGDELAVVSEHMQRSWKSFIWDAHPGWEPYTAMYRATQIFERETRMEEDPRAPFRRVWEEFDMRGWNGDESSVAMPRPGR